MHQLLLRFRLRTRLRHAGAIAREWEQVERSLIRMGSVTEGNAVDLINDGDAYFRQLWEALEHAQERVWMEMYIFEDDSVGKRTLDLLTQAAQRGCEVRLLMDAVGSPRITSGMLAPLREAGGSADFYNRILRWRPGRSLFWRDHRKIVIIDSAFAFCGGANISRDYAGSEFGNSLFHDCQLRLHGPCVDDLALLCAETLRDAKLEPGRFPRTAQRAGDSVVQVLASAGSRGRRDLQRAMRKCINHAVERCWITTPYFLPPLRLRRTIVRAAERGVDVRIITAGKSDVPMVRIAAEHIYGVFLRNRVRIYEYFPRTLHAKTLTIDGVVGMVGSFNLDRWSDRRLLDVNVLVLDDEVAEQMEQRFNEDLQQAREVTDHGWTARRWWRGMLCWSVYQLMRL